MNTLKTQAKTNALIVRFLKSRNFNPRIIDDVVVVGFISINNISEAITLNKHRGNL